LEDLDCCLDECQYFRVEIKLNFMKIDGAGNGASGASDLIDS